MNETLEIHTGPTEIIEIPGESIVVHSTSIEVIEVGRQGPAGPPAAWGEIAGDLDDQDDLKTALDGKIPLTQKAASNGVATLDASSKIPIAQIPDAVVGALNYQGTWNASTNTPALASSLGTKGYFYAVSVAGSINLDGITDWQVGDYVVYNGSVWQKIDNTESVFSVFGRTGAVVAATGDYSFSQISGTAAATQGGTGLTAYAQGDLIYASATNTPARLAKSTSATRYISNQGTNNNPIWAQVNLANGVTGNLPVSRLNSGISAYYGQYWDGSGQWLPLPTGGGGTLYDVLTAGNDTYGQSINISGGGSLSLSCGSQMYACGTYLNFGGSTIDLNYGTLYNQYGGIYTSYICSDSVSFGCGSFGNLYGSEVECYQFKSQGYYGITGSFNPSTVTYVEVYGGIITNWY